MSRKADTKKQMTGKACLAYAAQLYTLILLVNPAQLDRITIINFFLNQQDNSVTL